LDENLPDIHADPAQMQQLIMNLVINASEAMEGVSGQVIVSTAVTEVGPFPIAQTFRSDEPSLPAGRYVRLEVRDTGSGMSEETVSRIFDPFFTTKFTGRGLGLAAVSGILRGHRGAVRVDSQPGRGTTFTVLLPIVSDDANISLTEDPDSEATDCTGWGTILLTDDEELVRSTAKAALEQLGYKVLLAQNGKEAVDVFRDHRATIRLIILDLTMPVMSGEEALAPLRALDPSIPILLSSGYNQAEITRRFTEQKITGFIRKPYSVTQLNEAVAKALLDSVIDRPTDPAPDLLKSPL
jgi:CheY-like chemotaxis protein